MKTCGKGHEYSTLRCSVCAKAWRDTNKEKGVAYGKAYREENKSQIAANKKSHREENREQAAANIKAWRDANPDKVAAYRKAWKKANPEKTAAYRKAWGDANPDKVAANIKAWQKANPNKVAANNKAWRDANSDKVNAITAKRRATKLQQTPPWYNHEDVVAVYQLCPEDYEVDHIIPLQGKNVSGLHWHHNLQILPASVNRSKSNKFNPDTYTHDLPIY